MTSTTAHYGTIGSEAAPLALYTISLVEGEFEAVSVHTDTPFDFNLYGEFKYGRRSASEVFGLALAKALIERLAPLVIPGEEVVVLGTPYKNLPNAARLLALTVERHLRAAGFSSSFTRIYQDHVGDGVYAEFTQEERDRRNGMKNRFFDPALLEGRHVVVVDDVRITGSVQRSVNALLAPVPTRSLTMAHIAQLDPETAMRQPQLESRLNHLSVRGLPDLLHLMQDERDFALVTRVVRYVLKAEPHEVAWFLDQLNADQVTRLYEAVIEERYDMINDYRQTAELITARRNEHTIREAL